jgi:hypothetical protein
VTAVSASFISASPVLVLGVAVLGFVVYCEVDLAHAQGVCHLPKWLWAIICVVSIPLGGILYLTLGKRRRSVGGVGGANNET